jgi:SNF2 family DNA or RNA helicase
LPLCAACHAHYDQSGKALPYSFMRLRAQLFPFQREFVDKLCRPEIAGRLCGDEMGVGKTYEMIAADAILRETRSGAKMRTLILAPWSIHTTWRRKLIELLGLKESDVVVIDRKKRATFMRAVQLGRARYYICHYEALRLKDMQGLQRITWFHIMADEIHRVKSPKALQTKAFKKLRTQYKTGASGSIADDKPQDFWMPLHWVRPDLFPNISTKDPTKKFVDDWCSWEPLEGRLLFDANGEPKVDEEGNELHQMHRRVTGMREDRLAEFHKLIAPFYMRRLKEEVLDLPPKIFTPIHVQLYPGQQKVYDDLKKRFVAWIGEHENEPLHVSRMFIVAQLVRLQQAALASLMFYDTGKVDRFGEPIRKVQLREPSAKLDAFMDWATDVKGPTVVFTQSRSMVELAAARLDAAGARVGVYTGSTPDRMRQPIIDDFQAGKLDFFLGTIKAGGEGITLTNSSTMAFFDRAWGPFRNKQAEDRIHREGQKRSCQIVDFYAPRTVDSKVRKTNIDKWAALKAVLGDED